MYVSKCMSAVWVCVCEGLRKYRSKSTDGQTHTHTHTHTHTQTHSHTQGVRDGSARVLHGRNTYSVLYATFDALSKQRAYRDLAIGRGKNYYHCYEENFGRYPAPLDVQKEKQVQAVRHLFEQAWDHQVCVCMCVCVCMYVWFVYHTPTHDLSLSVVCCSCHRCDVVFFYIIWTPPPSLSLPHIHKHVPFRTLPAACTRV